MFGTNLSIRDQAKVAQLIGAKNFDAAIRISASRLTNTAENAFEHDMIALCHHWAGRDDMAIASAKQALECDAKSFNSLQLLANIYAGRSDHEEAAHYARLGLENFPAPLPVPPQWLVRTLRSIFWLVGVFVPRFGQGAKMNFTPDRKPYEEWYAWAKQYLEWYEAVHGDPVNPKIH